jgi:hypothetical protein
MRATAQMDKKPSSGLIKMLYLRRVTPGEHQGMRIQRQMQDDRHTFDSGRRQHLRARY